MPDNPAIRIGAGVGLRWHAAHQVALVPQLAVAVAVVTLVGLLAAECDGFDGSLDDDTVNDDLV